MFIHQTDEVVECAAGVIGSMAIEGPEVAVQGVDDEQTGVGPLQGVFEHGGVAEAQRGGLGRAGGEDAA